MDKERIDQCILSDILFLCDKNQYDFPFVKETFSVTLAEA